MFIFRKTRFACAAICSFVFLAGSQAFANDCISPQRLAELTSGKWAYYEFQHRGVKHSGKTKYLPNGKVHSISKGIHYKRDTWKILNGYVVRYAPDRPDKKFYLLKIRDNCS